MVRIARLILLFSIVAIGTAQAGPLRDLLRERRAAHQQGNAQDGDQADELDGAGRSAPTRVPDGVRVHRDVAYGADKAQRLDVYTPTEGVQNAPVIVMVHGGGWRHGDKTMQTVVENKAAHWVPRGFVFISINYRMLPAAYPLTQAADVAHAVSYVQDHASTWGGDGRQLILMGHSAGAHLVSLLTASPQLAASNGVRPWLGTVALDSAAYDVTKIMQSRHMKLYDEPFGTDPAYWRSASPIDQLTGATPPLLAVCSSKRAASCEQAEAYVRKSTGLGNRAQVHAEALTHREINGQLGLAGAYTEAVDNFIAGLGAQVGRLLK